MYGLPRPVTGTDLHFYTYIYFILLNSTENKFMELQEEISIIIEIKFQINAIDIILIIHTIVYSSYQIFS
jgi:hypothetical protein